jgi:ATP synthase I chain
VQPDALLRRLWRTAVVVCLLMAAIGLLVFGPSTAVGVLGGGLLIGISFYHLATGTADLAALVSGTVTRAEKRQIAGRVALKLAGRYALLGFLAYVMIARLRLHPLGLLAGASSVAAAAFVEAARFLAKHRV